MSNAEICEAGSAEQLCYVKVDSLAKLKNSTKQLLYLLEEIESKTHSRNFVCDVSVAASRITNPIQPISIPYPYDQNVNEEIDISALKRLEKSTKQLDSIFLEDDIDDCSIYKRLTRKCHCLNHPNYNDFVIHFNEITKYTTSCLGEIIKNLKILKKFLYMGGDYTKNALIFLNEGFIESKPKEKIEITQGCTHADICSIFDEHSIIITCISWPCKYRSSGDFVTQNLAANFVYRLAEIEEGRRYLNYSSKISNDIKKVLRKKSALLEADTLDTLNATLNLLKPTFVKNMALAYFTKSIYEGIGKRTISDLLQYRKYMIIDEVLMNLDILKDYSCYDYGKQELLENLPALLILFKHVLVDYDDSQLNIVIASILNNIVSKKIIKPDSESKKAIVLTDTSTEPVQMKNEMCQIPPKRIVIKGIKGKSTLGVSPQNKQRQTAKRKTWEPSVFLNRSRKFTGDNKNSVIVVPLVE